ncbi:MAG: uncharacterized protein QOG62_1413 [Thermoleophilaceae bacterium]|jgi:alpha-beta hydrolase superfamily lysophospholipase|nr:uncharacterized protein [Thermoleophilaceae bacterium]
MKHRLPQPPEIDSRDGLSFALFMPDGDPPAGVVICHGAGSAKESHFEFARYVRDTGLAALAFDMRGHGQSEGSLDGRLLDDVLAMCDLIGGHAPSVAIRGSSLGGFCAISAAAARPGTVDSVVAICPAPADFLLRGLRSGRLEGFDFDAGTLEPLLERADLGAAVEQLSPATSLLLLHAQADESVPYTVSEELFGAAREPKRLIVLPGGHHRSIQHDPDMHAESIRFIERAAAPSSG